MIHNGIEYGIMAAYAEGFNILHNANAGKHEREKDAAVLWRRGSVIGSWLLDLTAVALLDSPHLTQFSGRVSDSGEGRWTAIAAIEEGVPASVLTAALHARFSSRDEDDFANKVLSAMRFQFGGHAEKPAGG